MQDDQDAALDAMLATLNTLDAKKLLKQLRAQSLRPVVPSPALDALLTALWNHPLLLDDCILVSGLLFVKAHGAAGASNDESVFTAARYDSHRHADWIHMALIRGLILQGPSDAVLVTLRTTTHAEIGAAIEKNRLVLLARHLENLLQINTREHDRGRYDAERLSAPLLSLAERTLRLQSDLVDYKTRDLLRAHISVLLTRQSASFSDFAATLVARLAETGKIALQLYPMLVSSCRLPDHLLATIFHGCVSRLRVKGLGSAAAECISLILASDAGADFTRVDELLDAVLDCSSSRNPIDTVKLLLTKMTRETARRVGTRLAARQTANTRPMDRLLSLLLEDGAMACEQLTPLLAVADETVSIEAFSLLVRDAVRIRRRPTEQLLMSDCVQFRRFVEDTAVAGSVEFRQRVLAVSKSFYEQLHARIYALTRQLISANVDASVGGDDAIAAPVDSDSIAIAISTSLATERQELLEWMKKFVRDALLAPYDLVHSNFGTVDFVLRQLRLLLTSFVSLDSEDRRDSSDRAVRIGQHIRRDMDDMIHAVLHPALPRLIQCVGTSTYDGLRVIAMDIVVKCRVAPAAIPVTDFDSGLSHPRATVNEGAARIVQLHARLSGAWPVNETIDSLARRLDQLALHFPASLGHNNINGRILLLRLLLDDRPSLSPTQLETIVRLALQAGNLVASIASHPSPEGLDADAELGADCEDDEDITDRADSTDSTDIPPRDTTQPTGQYVLSFAWRVIKETALLLETLISNYPAAVISHAPAIIDHFVALMLQLRHRGAFSSLEAPLATVLRLGCSFPDKMLLLQRILAACLQTSDISTTRRSAGLPHLVLALVHSCDRVSELDVLLPALTDPLLAAAHDGSASPGPSVLHALNILRSLVRDSRLATEIAPAMPRILALCVDSFNAPHWPVRNGSAMLLSAAIARIFGSVHLNRTDCDSANDADSVINTDSHYSDGRVDVRDITAKFPGLIEQLVHCIAAVPRDMRDPRLVYPMLAILGRLRVPPGEQFASLHTCIFDFLFGVLERLVPTPGCGGKLVFVIARTFASLVRGDAEAASRTANRLLVDAPCDANFRFNLLAILAAIHPSIPRQLHPSILAQLHNLAHDASPAWNPLVAHQLHRTIQLFSPDTPSHKSSETANVSVEKEESPVISLVDHLVDFLANEAAKPRPSFQFMIDGLTTLSVQLTVINQHAQSVLHAIINRFPLCEEVVRPALTLLCISANDSVVDERLSKALLFYARFEMNENVRHIALHAISRLSPHHHLQLPHVCLALLTDDDDDIRTATCALLAPLWHNEEMNLAESLRRYVALVGTDAVATFIRDTANLHRDTPDKSALFEHEPLNAFINVNWLTHQFLSNSPSQ